MSTRITVAISRINGTFSPSFFSIVRANEVVNNVRSFQKHEKTDFFKFANPPNNTLNGELASANINFFAIDITFERALKFLLTAEQKGPHLIEYIRKQFGQCFGMPPPTVIEFLSPPGDGAKVTINASHQEEPLPAKAEAEPAPPFVRPWDPNQVVRTR